MAEQYLSDGRIRKWGNKRDCRCIVRLSADEKEMLQELMETYGLNESEMLRQCIKDLYMKIIPLLK